MPELFASEDGPLFLAIGLTVLMMVVIGIGMIFVMAARSRARFKKRLAAIGGAGAAAAAKGGGGRKGQQRRLLIQGKLDEIEGDKKKRAERVTMRRKLEMAGLDVTPKQFYIATAVLGVVTLLVIFILRLGPLPALIGGIGMGFGAPRMLLAYMTAKRKDRFIANFADAVDIIVRGIRSGLPLGECLNIIARESPDPIDIEFRHVMESTRLGLPLSESMDRAAERVGVAEFKFFAIVLAIQAETGGNLAETLSNLSNILRARKAMKDKIKAMSSEARTTAMIIGSLPFGMGTILFLTSPDYLMELFTSSGGNIAIVAGLVSMAVGSAIMAKMINFKI